LGIVSSTREKDLERPKSFVETATAVELRNQRGFPQAVWKSLAKNAQLFHRSHKADGGINSRNQIHFSLSSA
jgi:hypothetical protein